MSVNTTKDWGACHIVEENLSSLLKVLLYHFPIWTDKLPTSEVTTSWNSAHHSLAVLYASATFCYFMLLLCSHIVLYYNFLIFTYKKSYYMLSSVIFSLSFCSWDSCGYSSFIYIVIQIPRNQCVTLMGIWAVSAAMAILITASWWVMRA